MAKMISSESVAELEQMHALYRAGGADRGMAPDVVYRDASCPHNGCEQSLRAIDFRLDAFGRSIHDPLVRAWWDDAGFAGRCPSCGGWIHFTIRGYRPLSEAEARDLSQLPADWADEAVIL